MSDHPVLAGAEPWSYAGGEAGVLVLHGFTGSPQSMRRLAEAFAAAGFTVELPLLPGHGTRVEDMVPTRFGDYTQAVEDVCADLVARCEPVLVAGLSLGGTLALWLAAHHAEIAGLVLVNPLVEPAAESFVAMLTQALAQGVETIPGIGSDIKAPGVSELAYPATPVAPLLSVQEGATELVAELGNIRCPVLLFSSVEDHVVPTASGDLLEKTLGERLERVWLTDSYHVATLDHDAERIEEGAVAFARRVVGAERPVRGGAETPGPDAPETPGRDAAERPVPGSP